MILNKRVHIAQENGRSILVENLKQGDVVLVADKNLNWSSVKVKSIQENPSYPKHPILVNIQLKSGRNIISTPDQLYLTHKLLPVKADDINTRHILKTYDGNTIAVTNVERTISIDKMYGIDFDCDNYCTQLVNINGVIAIEEKTEIEAIV